MKKILLIIVCIMIILGIFVGVSYGGVVKAPLKSKEDIKVTVQENSSFYGVLDSLKEEGVLKSDKFVKVYLKLHNINPHIKPGNYTFKKDITLEKFISDLSEGKSSDSIKVTIPEGKNLEEIGEILEVSGITTKDKFIKACDNYPLPKYITPNPERKHQLEGYLYPDTYAFSQNMDDDKIIETMLNNFTKVMNELTGGKQLTNEELNKLITMASIVEKEIATPSEREKAASVFYNRLKINMPLQSCATVLYALGYHKDIVLEKDLEIDSKYNTYKVPSLPIGPICSPGKASIEAAMHPANTNYLYFVSLNNGTHFFTDNYEEFEKVKSQTQNY